MVSTDNIVSYYKLDGTSGDVVDSAGSNTGTNNGADRGATGKISNAFDFERTDNDTVDLTNFDVGASFTISFWWKPESIVSYNFIITKWYDSGNQRAFQIGSNSDGDLFVQVSTNGSDSPAYFSSPVFSAGNWYHVVLTYDAVGEALEGWVNNSSVLEQTPSAIYQSSAKVLIGNNQNYYENGWTDGIVDEVGIWSRVLTDTEIGELYNSGNGLTYPFTTGTNLQVNIGDTWKEVPAMKVNIGDSWKEVAAVKTNIGDTWKEVF